MRMMFAVFLMASTGCSSVVTLSVGSSINEPNMDPNIFSCDEYAIPRVYSGVANVLRFLRGDYPDAGIVVLDLPFSFIADTIALPYTIFTQAIYGNLCDRWEVD